VIGPVPCFSALERRDLPTILQVEAGMADGWTESQLHAELESAVGWQYGLRTEDGRLTAYVLGRSVVDEAEILRLAVLPAWRRQGLATGLLAMLRAALFRRGVRTCHLEVRAANRAALALYARAGFVVSGRRKHYYKNPEEDAVLMTANWTEEG